MKKLLALLLAIALLLGATACGKEKEETPKAPPDVVDKIPPTESKSVKQETNSKDKETSTKAEKEAGETSEVPKEEPEEDTHGDEPTLSSMEPEEDHSWEEDAPPAF